MKTYKEFCIEIGQKIVDEKLISLGHKNEQLYAICCALAVERAYRHDQDDKDIWRFCFSTVDAVANYYYDAFIKNDIESLLRL